MGIIKNWIKERNSEEYKELRLQIDMLWMEVDIITQRWKRKVKPPVAEETMGVQDPFDELRKINKEHPLK